MWLKAVKDGPRCLTLVERERASFIKSSSQCVVFSVFHAPWAMGRGTSEGVPWRLSHFGTEYLVVSREAHTQSLEHAKTCAKTAVNYRSQGFVGGLS